MWLFRCFCFCFLPLALSTANAEDSIPSSKSGLNAFETVCLPFIGKPKLAIANIANVAESYTESSKIISKSLRSEHMIPDGDDAWGYSDNGEWFIIMTDYGSCSVRTDGDLVTFRKRITDELGMTGYFSEREKLYLTEYYTSQDNLVVLLSATKNSNPQRIAVTAYNRDVYRKAIKEYGSDFPPLPDMEEE